MMETLTLTEKEHRWINSLVEIKNLLEKNGISFFLDSGTLLGFARDKHFIKWDNDIDLGIVSCRYDDPSVFKFINDLEKNNIYNINYAVNKLSLTKNPDIEINIIFYEKNQDFYFTTYSKPRHKNAIINFLINVKEKNHIYSSGSGIKYKLKKMIINNCFLLSIFNISFFIKKKHEYKTSNIPNLFFDNITTVKFYQYDFLIPVKHTEYLTYRYGENWKTPLKRYNYYNDDKSLS